MPMQQNGRTQQALYPLLFSASLHEKMWGGTRLRSMKGLQPDNVAVGESWEVSAMAEYPGVVENGPLAGRTLAALVAEYGSALLGKAVTARCGAAFPLLVKLLDTAESLSVQVHPDAALARKLHGCPGKSEMWYVLDAAPGACLYLGFNTPVTLDELRRHAVAGTICDVLNKIEAHKGDAFFIPAGCVHSLGAGLLIAEIQQSSDITYRLYDFGRPRELHLDQAVEAVDYTCSSYSVLPSIRLSDGVCRLVNNDCFTVNELSFTSSLRRDLLDYGSFVLCLCVEGECIVRTAQPDTAVLLPFGRSVLLPANIANYTVEPVSQCGGAKVLECYMVQ